MNNIDLNTEQYDWLYKIRDDGNFYKSLEKRDRLIVYEMLSHQYYDVDIRTDINRIRELWIRYVKLNSNKDI